jgi:hypothetical protein
MLNAADIPKSTGIISSCYGTNYQVQALQCTLNKHTGWNCSAPDEPASITICFDAEQDPGKKVIEDLVSKYKPEVWLWQEYTKSLTKYVLKKPNKQ